MGTAVRPAKTSLGPWDAFADIDVFVDEVLAALAAMAMNGARRMRSGPKPPLAGAALRKAVMAIWCVCFCGMQWRAIGLLRDIPFGTLYGLFARWTRLGLWRRLLNRLRRTWRLACGDTPEPSAVVIDSRSCRSAPSRFDRGIGWPADQPPYRHLQNYGCDSRTRLYRLRRRAAVAQTIEHSLAARRV